MIGSELAAGKLPAFTGAAIMENHIVSESLLDIAQPSINVVTK